MTILLFISVLSFVNLDNYVMVLSNNNNNNNNNNNMKHIQISYIIKCTNRLMLYYYHVIS